jgi:hypothetical protein
MTYCILPTGNRYVNRIQIWMNGGNANFDDGTDRTTSGCYTVDMDGTYSDGYSAEFEVSGTTGSIQFSSVTTTWELAPPAFIPAVLPALSLDGADADASSLEARSTGD